MHLTHLGLQHFRNYERLTLELEPGVTLFLGDNGQGKTNLLESVYLLATTRSPRTSSDRELMSWSERSEPIPFTRLEARVQRAEFEVHLEIVLRLEAAEAVNGSGPSPRVTKTIRVNGLPNRAAQLVGQVNVVYFAPEDVGLVAGTPAARRRYLDITHSQVSPLYLRTLQRYQRVLLQRNSLLRQVRENRQQREMLEFWTSELVAAGGYLVAHRVRMVRKLADAARRLYQELSGTTQSLSIRYETTTRDPFGDAELNDADLQARFRTRLAHLQMREIEAGMSLAGPHRDDLIFEIENVDVGVYGSRGQQRLVVLALKLAENEFLSAETGESPILLLDDVLSELDSRRRRLVLARVMACGQTLASGTEMESFTAQFLQQARVLTVDSGAVRSAGTALT